MPKAASVESAMANGTGNSQEHNPRGFYDTDAGRREAEEATRQAITSPIKGLGYSPFGSSSQLLGSIETIASGPVSVMHFIILFVPF